MDSLLPVIVGALLAFVGGVIGAWIQGRREHGAWLREKRYEAFVKVKSFSRRVQEIDASLKKAEHANDPEWIEAGKDALSELWDELAEASAPLAVLGPNSVDQAASGVIEAMSTGDADAIEEAEGRFILAMRKALRIKD